MMSLLKPGDEVCPLCGPAPMRDCAQPVVVDSDPRGVVLECPECATRWVARKEVAA